MARINPKLNLNKTPQNSEDYSLVFAKNIKVNVDGTIGRDNNITNIPFLFESRIGIIKQEDLLCAIPYNNKLYLLLQYEYHRNIAHSKSLYIKVFDEELNEVIEETYYTGLINHGGIFEGVATSNLRGDVLLIINEYFEKDSDNTNDYLIPIRTINLSTCRSDDDESIYTCVPKKPIVNINVEPYSYTIPNGIYQFFIRWELYDNTFTDWMPCTKLLYAGNNESVITHIGSLKHIDTLVDSNNSFKFTFEVINDCPVLYKKFQLGFILNNDDNTVARIWKKFDYTSQNIPDIYFTYNQEDIKETTIEELLRQPYSTYNNKNIISFKTNLYVSNYDEYNTNVELDSSLLPTIDLIYDVKKAETVSTYLAGYIYKSLGKTTTFDIGNGLSLDSVSVPAYVYDLIVSDGNYSYKPDDFSFDVETSRKTPFEDTITTYDLSATCNIRKKVYCYNNKLRGNYNSHTSGANVDSKSRYYGEISPFAEAILNTPGHIYYAKLWYDQGTWVEYTYYFVINGVSQFQKVRVPRSTENIDGELSNPTDENLREIFNSLYNKEVFFEDTQCTALSNDSTSNLFKQLLDDRCLYIRDENNGTQVVSKLYTLNDYQQIFDAYNFDTNSFSSGWSANTDTITIGVCKTVYTKYVGDDHWHGYTYIINEEYTIEPKLTKVLDSPNTITNNLGNFDTIQTLLPYVDYTFYLHKIDNAGIVSNGTEIGVANFTYFDLRSAIHPIVDDTINPINVLKAETDEGYAICYPKFTFSTTIPDNCFITCIAKNKVAHAVNITKVDDTNNNDYWYCADVLECDLNLLPAIPSKPLIICINDRKYNCTYYHSSYYNNSDTNSKYTFGSSGKLFFNISQPLNDDGYPFTGNTGDNAYLNNPDSGFIIINDDNNELFKVTPYLSAKNLTKLYSTDNNPVLVGYEYNNYDTLQLDGYAALITKLLDPQYDENHNDDTAPNIKLSWKTAYTSEDDIYKKDVTPTLTLKEIYQEDSDGDMKRRLGAYVLSPSYTKFVYSHYNLQYLSLRENLNQSIVTIDKTKTGSTAPYDIIRTKQQIYKFNSLTLSDIYKLPAMYKEVVRPVYEKYEWNKTVVTKFDNTIHRSIPIGDEESVYVYKFNPLDYYNIPVNKGIIVKLLSIGEAIIVHTKDSIFKFSGTNTITGNGTENLQLQETNVFESGVSELFGSEQGYGGLQHKWHSAVSQTGYLLYDVSCYTMYFFDGTNTLQPISDNIKKALQKYKFQSVRIGNDYFNNRLICCFYDSWYYLYDDDEDFVLTISYSTITKTWCSLHDYRFDRCYSTKTRLYLEKYADSNLAFDNTKLYKIELTNDDSFIIPNELKIDDLIYPYIDKSWTIDEETINSKYSMVDIILKVNYETIKTLNFISWICNKVIGYSDYLGLNTTEIDTYKKNTSSDTFANHYVPKGFGVAEEPMAYDVTNETITKTYNNSDLNISDVRSNPYLRYKGDKIWIYTDSCYTPIINILPTDKDSDNISNVFNYKYPTFNNGIWSFNYFKNVRGYMFDGTTNRDYNSDVASNIYGKYFVVRFIFSPEVNFKLENLSINYNTYIE